MPRVEVVVGGEYSILETVDLEELRWARQHTPYRLYDGRGVECMLRQYKGEVYVDFSDGRTERYGSVEAALQAAEDFGCVL